VNQKPEDDADILGVFGADPKRWPPDRRAATEQRLRDDPRARRAWAEAARLDAVLDGYGVADDPARLAAVGEAILAEIAGMEDADDWALGPIGWPQGLGVASAVGLLTAALLVFGLPMATGTEAGLHDMLASTLWLGTY